MITVKRFFEFIVRILFPPRCIECRQVIEIGSYYSVCSKCFSSISFVKGRACKLCGKSVGKTAELEEICSSCKDDKDFTINFDEVICPCEYSGIIKKAIRSFKYHRKRRLSKFLAIMVEEKLRMSASLKSIDLITCIPIHKNKLRHRGYNQSELIAAELSRNLDIPINTTLLCKIKETESQSRLTRKERLENVQGCYEACNPELIKDKNILLIDDVITTGATLNECSLKLREAGAGKILVAVAATGRSRQ